MKFIFTKVFIVAVFSVFLNLNAQTEQYVETNDNVKLFSKKSGSGPICIFVHGGPGAWSRSFEDLGGSNLEDKLTMIYYDQRGSGRSEDAKNVDYSLDRMVEDIEAIRKKYNAKKVFLMGHSFGGILISSYAKKYPQNLKGLIFLNSTLHVNESMQNQISYMQTFMDDEFKNSTDFGALRYQMQQKGMLHTLLTESKENSDLLDKVDSYNPSNYTFGSKAFNIQEYHKDFSEDSPFIKTPSLVITGTKDFAIGVDHYKKFKFPNMEVKSIEGGHLLYYEKNKELKDALVAFVQKHK